MPGERLNRTTRYRSAFLRSQQITCIAGGLRFPETGKIDSDANRGFLARLSP